MAERIMLALDGRDRDQSESFVDEVFSGLLPDAHDLLILLAAADNSPDWSVFNSGAEVAGGLTYAEAMNWLTPERLERGWYAVCVVSKESLASQPPVGDAS
jgi:hypothetical protein